ncbi:TonB-dependent siderophore receptor [Acetobacter sp. TBRC 12305]|uniref:TonB-dependent siderophore receptor n=1 Tax=Acetobacter garciniae TaxID=2817435 RepID=A0A939HII6_9PROT|nr:TonB-dependent siderophore receptor [Acetobacter garciniae]MBO1325063.1 TonB-dependent siderophore receptor [Acetobacter garciniae]MBX0344966.1 TonB-dependent siderophore receptor [Acetobacter garciniae]
MEPSPSLRRPFTASMFLLGATTALTAVMMAKANAQTSVSAPATSAAVSAQAVNFDIPAGKLSSALVAFSTQAHVPLSSQTPVLAGKMSSELRGQFTPSAALSHILSGSGLSYRVVGGSGFQIVPASSAATITLGPVRVGGTVAHQDPTGPGVGYVATTTMSGTKTDTPITEIPNSIYVITKQLMSDQQPQNVAEALRYTPGVYSESLGNYSNGSGILGGADGIMQRGFSTTSFVDGLALNSASAGETAFIERIEAVNGPASVMYGQTNPGGMIGISLKKPTETPLHQVSVGFGSWGRYEATADVSDKITKSGNLRYRIAAIGVTSGTQVDQIGYHRVGVLPSLTWDIDPKTSLTLLGMYMYTPGNGTNYMQYPTCGTLIQSSECPRIPKNTFTGYKSWNQNGSREAMFEYLFKHEFSKYISFSQTFRYENSESNKKDTYTSEFINSNEVAIVPWSIQGRAETIGLDSRIYGNFSTGPVNHTWVVGSDFRKVSYLQNALYDRTATYTQSIYNPSTDAIPCLDLYSTACKVRGSMGPYSYFQEGVYFQDQIKWKGFSVLLGGREDWVNYKSDRYSVSTNNSSNTLIKSDASDVPEPQHAFTWRAGLTYNTKFGLAPYFSYSTSFVPQAGSTNYLGQPFSPLTGNQLEAGLKYKIPNRDVLLTAAAFHINENHYLISDLEHSGFSTDVGKVRSQGFEVAANANITRDFRVVASYTYTDMRFANTNVTAKRTDPLTGSTYGNAVSEEGKVVPQMPRNMFSIFADYTIPSGLAKGLGINWGLRYIGYSYATNVESFKVPSYILFDIGTHYDLGQVFPALKGLKAQLAVSNLTNKYYVTSCGTLFCYVGQGRRFYGNLTYNW